MSFSDHKMIFFDINKSASTGEDLLDKRRTNWKAFRTELKKILPPVPEAIKSREELDKFVSEFSVAIIC